MRRRLYGGILTGALVAVIVIAVILVLVLTKGDNQGTKNPNNQTQTGQESNNNNQDNDSNDDTNDDADENTGNNGNTDAGENDNNSGSNEDANGNDGAGDDEDADNDIGTGEEELAINEKIAALAIEQIGKGYEWGEEGPDNFDASGLIFYCYTQNGISIPRTIKEMATHGAEIDEKNMLPGDVVFFWNDTPGTEQFVGLYIGDGKIIIVSSRADAVQEISVDSDYYQKRFVSVRRFWE